MNKPRSSNNKKPKESAKGITAISIRGYKSLYDECRLEIRPLTILAGANSSGKSSAMQPLLLLKQTLEASYDPGALLLNDPNVRLTSVDQLLSMVAGKRTNEEFMIRLEIDDRRYLANTFKKHPKKHIELAKMEYYDGNI
ncbi:MAG: AAA family ATPase [bacterium]